MSLTIGYTRENDRQSVNVSKVVKSGETYDEVSLNEFGCDGTDGDGSSGFSIISTLIAKDTTRERDVEVRVGERVSTDVWQVDPIVADGLVSFELHDPSISRPR
jgi:hypothetical protein